MSRTIITRLYPDTKSAEAVRTALLDAGQREQTIDVIDKSGAAGGKAARELLVGAGVRSENADAYAEGVASGKALVVVQAPFVPFGTALNAIRIVDGFPSLDVDVDDQNFLVRDEPRHTSTLSVLTNNPLFLTRDLNDSSGSSRGTLSADFGIPLLTKDRAHKSVIPGGAFISQKFLPFPLLTRDRRRDSVIHGDAFMSRKLLPFPLLTRDRRRNSVIHGGGTPLSAMLGLPLLSGRR